MNAAIDLTAEQRRTVLALLNRYLPNTTVWAYGSRVKWTSQPASDLDLVAFAEPGQAAQLAELREAFDASDLPFRVDLFVWDDVPEGFHARIETEHVALTRTRVAEAPAGNGWSMATLDACAALVGEKVSPASCYDTPYIGLEHIGQGTLSLVGVGKAQDVESTKTAFRSGDILFGKLRPYFRKVALPRFDGICSTDIWVMRPLEGVDAGFLFYVLASSSFVEFANQGTEGTRMPRAKWEHVRPFRLQLPPLEEQHAIASILGALDDKIELNRRMASTLGETVQALYKSWFVDFDPVRASARQRAGLRPEVVALFPRDFVASDIGEAPSGWEVRPLGDLVEFAYGSALRASERNGGSVPVFGSNGQVGWHDRALVDGPGIVVGRKGNPGVVTWTQGNFFPIDTTFYVVPKDDVSVAFLFCALRHQNLPAIAADSAVPGLNRNIAYMSRQLVPSAAVMRAFDHAAAPVLSWIGRCEREANALAALRDALLPRLISGEVRLPSVQ